MIDFNNFLKNELNNEQKKAVMHTEGPLLIVAGAGSGKTRVITARIAYLLLHGKADPSSILSLTFTNKAAQEMKERIQHFLAHSSIRLPFVGTFHSYCLSLLKKNGHFIARSHFSILDEEDRAHIITSIIKRNGLQKNFSAKSISYYISQHKNRLTDPSSPDFPEQHALLMEIYHAYEKEKNLSNCLDFDDLILEVLRLFQNNIFKSQFQQTIRHVLIDEYQDTNNTQHALLKAMGLRDNHLALDSICAVGDEDQSIYSWRGATVDNIAYFQKDFSDTTVITIEQNYRSVQPILTAANNLISHNSDRKPKKLWSTKQARNRISSLLCQSDYQEAQAIIYCIRECTKKKSGEPLAILYRTHFQSRSIEEALVKNSIPYKIIGGINFYQRKEIKDVLAYLRLVANPLDRASLIRIINVPGRGLGQSVEQDIDTAWREQSFYNFQDLLRYLIDNKKVTGKKAESVELFLSIFADLTPYSEPHYAVNQLISRSHYIRYLQETYDTQDSLQRIDNIRELLNAIKHMNALEVKTVQDFLDHVALMQDHIQETDEAAHPVLLMTLHAAKGLEFDTVIITGLEEGLLPSSRSLSDIYAIEEERRLFYVGMTRAKERLLLTRTKYRYTYGSRTNQIASRFIQEIPTDIVHEEQVADYAESQLSNFFSTWLGTNAHTIPIYTFGSIPPAKSSTPSISVTSDCLLDDKKKIKPVAEKKSLPLWHQNQVVSHQTFGMGIIKNIEEKVDATYITVQFKKSLKKLAAQFLKRI